LAALVPAEALSLHAVVLGFTTKAKKGQTMITDATTLKWAFWALLVLCPALFLAGRSLGKEEGTKTTSW
jgi:hypothetical protein